MDDKYSTHQHPFRPMSPTIRIIAATWFDLPDLERDMPMPTGLLVGEQPRPGGNPKLPLWPWPDNCAGARLLRMSGLDLLTFFSRLARVNVAEKPVARWDANGARRRGAWILRSLPNGTRVVACGARPRNALGLAEWFKPIKVKIGEVVVEVVAIPHPSGRNREYNNQIVRRQTGQWIRWAARIGRASE